MLSAQTREQWACNDSEQPTDTVSSISWCKTSVVPTFAAGGWDSHVRIYQIDPEESSLRQPVSLDAQAPCLGVDWHEDNLQVFAGCASGDIKSFNAGTGQESDIGSHARPVKDVHWVADLNVLCSVSFDKTVKLWDLRQAGLVYQCELRDKPLYSDVHGNQLALALSEFQVTVVDLPEALKAQSSQKGLRYVESPLGSKDPLSCIKFLPDGERLAFGSAGGRCNISRLERVDPQTIKLHNVMTFKAHKTEQSGISLKKVYPVNSILVNSKRPNGFLGTCGGEGKIYYWDFIQKNKICELEMHNSVTCGKMSWDGNWLAIATGYDWSRGISEYMTKRSEVFVRPVREGQLTYR